MRFCCRVCDSPNICHAVDLGRQPWANDFLCPDQAGHEPYYPLRVVQCQECLTAQLDYTVPKETLFGNHTYLSGVTRTLDEHCAAIAGEADSRFCSGRHRKSVLDIGSNDGTQLKHFERLGYSVLGVESSQQTAETANHHGIETIHAFFNLELAKSLGRRFDIINAAGVFFHLEELHSVTDGIRECLREDGVFIVQFLYMKRIVDNLAFDQIYHEHLLYYNIETITALLRMHGLEMFDCYLSPVHGGSIIGFVTQAGDRQGSDRLLRMLQAERSGGYNLLETYTRFARDILRRKAENLQFLMKARNDGKRIFGLGAPVKGNSLLNYFGVGPDLIECLVD
jgi:SAM-dependent methyltransferase